MSAIPISYWDHNVPQGSLSVLEFYNGPGCGVSGVDFTSTQFGDGFDIGPIGYR